MTVRRLKTYTSEAGYVYQYYFVGKRPASPESSGIAATTYVFDVSSDRHSYFAVTIFVREDALAAWKATQGRGLTEPEQYAVAKMALFEAFDTVTELANSEKRFFVTPENICNFVEVLNLD